MNRKNALLLIAGLPTSGKTEFGSAFAAVTGRTAGSPSDIIYRELAEEMGVTVPDLHRIPKETLRPELIRVGDRITAEDPAALIKMLASSGVTVISGIRKKRELAAVRSKYPDAVIVWIYRASPFIQDNTDLKATDCDMVIVNDGSLEELHSMVYKVIRLFPERFTRVVPDSAV